LLSKVNIESIISTNQSGKKHPPGIDSYYWHNVYTKGWMHDKFSIGNAFINPTNNRIKFYNIELTTHNNIHLYFYKINEFQYYGNKEEPSALINFNHNKIINKKNGLGISFTSIFPYLTINHQLNFENSRNEKKIGYKIKFSKLLQL